VPRSPFAAAWRTVADAAAIEEGTSLLDLGCGDGAFCAFAAARGANAHGVDADPDALARALLVVPDGHFRVGLIENLAWPDDTFDVVTAFNALQYALDPERALAEARRVVRPTGRLAVCKWGRPSDNEFFSLLLALGLNGLRRDDLPASDPIERTIRRARLDVLATGSVPAPITMPDNGALEASLSRAARTTALGDVVEAALPYRQADGSYRFDNRLRYWILQP
jgi:SAM-dependent methyltransferase